LRTIKKYRGKKFNNMVLKLVKNIWEKINNKDLENGLKLVKNIWEKINNKDLENGLKLVKNIWEKIFGKKYLGKN